MASIRIRQRKDGTAYTSVLYVHEGKQTSSSFNDHSEALRFRDVVDRLGPAEALRVWEAAMPTDGHTVASNIAEHLHSLSGTEKKTVAEYRRYLLRDVEPMIGHIPLSTLTRADLGAPRLGLKRGWQCRITKCPRTVHHSMTLSVAILPTRPTGPQYPDTTTRRTATTGTSSTPNARTPNPRRTGTRGGRPARCAWASSAKGSGPAMNGSPVVPVVAARKPTRLRW